MKKEIYLRMITLRGYAARIIAIIICVQLFWNCSSLYLQNGVREDKLNWQQYGGNKERTNIATSIVQPPLQLAWMADASAGFSEYSASIVDSLVFLGTLQGELYALHIETGEEAGSYDFGFPIVGTPVIANGMAYVAVANSEESLFGYDLLKGKVAWKARLGGIETSPLLMDGKLFVTALNGEAYCLEAVTGKVLWKFIAPLFDRSAFFHSSPASDGSSVVFGCDDGSLFCISAEDGKLLWRCETKKSLFGTPSVSDGMVFIGSQDEAMYAVSLSNGAIIWKQQLGSRIYSSQAVSSNNIYAGTSAGEIFCLEKKTGEIRWRYTTGSVISTAPLLSGNIVYGASLDKTVYALDAGTGGVLWKYTTEARIKSMPVAWGNTLVLPLDNRMVIAFKGLQSQ